MSKESYFRGFCKVAEEYGVDPVILIKYAQSGPAGTGPLRGNEARAAVQGLYDNGYITEMNTPMRTRLDAIERANPDVAARHGYVTVGETAPKEYRAAREVTDALSEGVASGRIKLPAATKAAPAATKVAPAATKAAPAAVRAARVSRLARFFGRK